MTFNNVGNVWNKWLLGKGNYNLLTDSDSGINWAARTVNFNRTGQSLYNNYPTSIQNNGLDKTYSYQNNGTYQYGHGAIPIDQKKDYGTHEQAFKNIGYGAAILSGLNQMRDKTYLNMARTASQNADLARSQIMQTGIAGANEANAIRERGDRAISSATAGYGTMGVTADSGSATDVQSGIAQREERNAEVMTQNAMLKQWALGNEAAQYDAQAATYKNMYKQNKLNGLLNMALTAAKIYYGVGG